MAKKEKGLITKILEKLGIISKKTEETKNTPTPQEKKVEIEIPKTVFVAKEEKVQEKPQSPKEEPKPEAKETPKKTEEKKVAPKKKPVKNKKVSKPTTKASSKK